jgi:hypothetical protein
MNYTITIPNEVQESIEYLLINGTNPNSILSPPNIAGKTSVQEVLQGIIDIHAGMFPSVSSQLKEREWVDTLKTDTELMNSVTAKILEVKQAKLLAEEEARLNEEVKIIVPDAPPEEVPQGI